MRRLMVIVLTAAVILGIAGTALAEHGTQDPFGGKVRTMEHGSQDPWGPGGGKRTL